MDGNIDLSQLTGHGLSIGAIIGSLFGWAPPVAAFAALVWYSIQIFDSDRVQNFLHQRRIRKLAALRKQIAAIEAVELIRHHTPKHNKEHH